MHEFVDEHNPDLGVPQIDAKTNSFRAQIPSLLEQSQLFLEKCSDPDVSIEQIIQIIQGIIDVNAEVLNFWNDDENEIRDGVVAAYARDVFEQIQVEREKQTISD